MEYLKSKMVAAKLSSEEESEDEAVNCDEGSVAEESSATETQQVRGSTGTLPGNRRSQEPGGFAFITFMFPEHAVKAYMTVDGQVFHLSSHNWNTLFVGPNAVAEAITQKYIATKSQVLDHETTGSVAVRVAPGETKLVQEVQHFLLHNGVSLDSFSQEGHCPLHTDVWPGTCRRRAELLCSCLPSEGLMGSPGYQPGQLDMQEGKKSAEEGAEASKPRAEEEEEEEEEEDKSLPGCTLFIKNLNFNTTEEMLREVSIHQ
ncbi:putative RNA-binding protein 19, partial [Sciurus carolinensis]|nr:putative RNA-binding protein 19 [Sciurus carolinensis]